MLEYFRSAHISHAAHNPQSFKNALTLEHFTFFARARARARASSVRITIAVPFASARLFIFIHCLSGFQSWIVESRRASKRNFTCSISEKCMHVNRSCGRINAKNKLFLKFDVEHNTCAVVDASSSSRDSLSLNYIVDVCIIIFSLFSAQAADWLPVWIY